MGGYILFDKEAMCEVMSQRELTTLSKVVKSGSELRTSWLFK